MIYRHRRQRQKTQKTKIESCKLAFTSIMFPKNQKENKSASGIHKVNIIISHNYSTTLILYSLKLIIQDTKMLLWDWGREVLGVWD